jgi:hypothetical protein
VILLGLSVQSCSKYDELDDNLDNSIINSVELEEYIITGLDYKQSLNTFNNEIRNVYLSKLKTYQDSKGNMIVNIPTSVSIEEKGKIFNDKKKLLLDKYPQLCTKSQKAKRDYLNNVLNNSLKVQNMFIELKIQNNHIRLKGNSFEYMSSDDLCSYLASYVNSSSYVELVVIIFQDGTAATYSDTRNNINTCYYPTMIISNNTYYFTNKPVSMIAHTHLYSGTPSTTDITNSYPGLQESIYYSGSFYYY